MMEIKTAALEDLDDAVRLFTGYLGFYKREHPADQIRNFIQERLANKDSIIYLAYAEDRAVGIAQIYPTFSSLSLARSWVLNDLFVDPETRGTGAGRALLKHVCSEAAAAGAVDVVLETAEDNTTAQALYESEGFTKESGFYHYSRSL